MTFPGWGAFACLAWAGYVFGCIIAYAWCLATWEWKDEP